MELLNAEAEELEGDYITLPNDENEDAPTFSFVVDRNGAEEVRMMECPLDVEEALCLVRRVRDGRMNMVAAMANDLSVNLSDNNEVLEEDGFIRIF